MPPGLDASWTAGSTGVTLVEDRASSTPRELDAVDSVLTGCAVAIAETGTLVLDAGPDQGRRRITLVPDHHLCVVRVPGQVVGSVPEALPRLAPDRPLTWISGPSATSDIELDRVEGARAADAGGDSAGSGVGGRGGGGVGGRGGGRGGGGLSEGVGGE